MFPIFSTIRLIPLLGGHSQRWQPPNNISYGRRVSVILLCEDFLYMFLFFLFVWLWDSLCNILFFG